jgi:outer membrane receptor protein involved in Fe transport
MFREVSMKLLTRSLGVLIILLVCSVTATSGVEARDRAAPVASQSPAQQPPPDAEEEPEITYEETVVVTASRTEQALINAPATITVIDSQTIENSPGQTFADLMRNVPGMNVTQLSARDISLTSRQATGTLATSQLALLDGRSIYQDFFGFVMWDFLPVHFSEIKQIEVIRGPASAVWGANAQTGVVNVITKAPREMPGTAITIGAGGFGRSSPGADEGLGGLFYANAVHAQAVNDRWAYKVSGGVYTQAPLPRPVGVIPNQFRTPYPTFENQGTVQPKIDGRVDYDFEDGRQKLIVAGGVAGTEGIIHTGIGPFDINTGSVLGYGKTNYSRGPLRLNAFVNLLDGDAANLLTVDPQGRPLVFRFSNQTYDVEFANVQAIGTMHVLSYGGNVRHNRFDLSLAPRGRTRSEAGGYVQDEIFLSPHLRAVVGARVDKFDIIDGALFAPRVALLVKPTPEQTVRLSYNRAYRSPSLVNNFLEIGLVNEIDLGLINPALAGVSFPFAILATGNQDLQEESLTAYELGYTGRVGGRAHVSAAVYVNDTSDSIFFTQVGSYSSANAPPGWPLPPVVLDLLIASPEAFGPGLGLPAAFSYRNLGEVRHWGVELGVDGDLTPQLAAFVNYAWQGRPRPIGFPLTELNLPPTHRFNTGFSFSHERYFGNLSVSYSDRAFWQDVLDARFHGETEPYTLVNTGVGVRWAGDRAITSLKITNLTNRAIQQHVFGDIMKRQVVAELRTTF